MAKTVPTSYLPYLMLQSHTAGFRTGSIRYQNRIDPVSPAETRIVTRVNSWGFRDYDTAKKLFGSCSNFFLPIFQFRINIRIEPVRTASTRFNPQRKTAKTLVIYRMTFIVTIRIWSGWKWAEWVVIYATVTNSRISNRVHTELKPHRTGSTRIDPHRNTCQFLRSL
jgi:hypothetical protein